MASFQQPTENLGQDIRVSLRPETKIRKSPCDSELSDHFMHSMILNLWQGNQALNLGIKDYTIK